MASIVDEALRYREELDLGVFPVDPVTKTPRITTWQRGGLRAPSSIAKVFGRNLQAGIGVTCGQMFWRRDEKPQYRLDPYGIPMLVSRYLVVLDADEHPDGRQGGLGVLASLSLPKTPTARTSNGGRHVWFWTPLPLPSYTRPDGLELKAAGAFVLSPPGIGRSWIDSPFELEIAALPECLLPSQEAVVVEAARDLSGRRTLHYGDALDLIRAAQIGSRHRTLLTQAGRIKYRVDRGLYARERAWQDLTAAALANGTGESEIERILKGVFALPPLVTTCARCAPHGVVELGEREKAVLNIVCRKWVEMVHESGRPFEKQPAGIASLRWLLEQSGIQATGATNPNQMRRSLAKLEAAELIWRRPFDRPQYNGTRPAHVWRPNYLGFAFCGIAIDAISEEYT
jgi:Bifunctional DNA primase/polymerase, N-terminal